MAHALAAEPNLAECQTSLGFLKFWLDWDWPGAESAYRSAIEMDPGYALAPRMLGVVLSHMGRHTEALQAMQRARELDPFYAMHHALSAQVAFAARDYQAAVRFAQQAIVIDPEFWIGHWQLAQARAELDDDAQTFVALDCAKRLSGCNTKTIALRGYLLARHGQGREAQEVLDTLTSIARERYVPPYAVALVHAGLQQHVLALHWLERAYEVRDVHLVFLPIDPKWDLFRSDTRFVALLQQCGFITGQLS